MRMFVKVSLILLLLVTPVFAEDDAPAFTDQDLGKYRDSTGSDLGTSMQTQDKPNSDYVSPQEDDLRRRKDEVIKENRDYIEEQYRWMKTDCNNYEGEFRKSCFSGTEDWYKEQLRKLEDLEEYLSK